MSVYNSKKFLLTFILYRNQNSVLIWRECMPPGNSGNLSEEGNNGAYCQGRGGPVRQAAGKYGKSAEYTRALTSFAGV